MKRPPFPVYVQDLPVDEDYVLMTHEEKGLYWELLFHSWLNDGLPVEEAKLAHIAGCSIRKFRRIASRVLRKFEANFDETCSVTRLVNAKQERIRAELKEYSEKQRKKAESRWGRDAAASSVDMPRDMPRDSRGMLENDAAASLRHMPLISSPEKILSPACDPTSPTTSGDAPAWGMDALSRLWLEVVQTSVTGNTMLLQQLVDRCTASAALRDGREAPAVHARRLLEAFNALVDGWKAGGRIRPQRSVEGWERNFVACEEILSGDRDPREAPRVGGARPIEPTRPQPPPAEDVIADRAKRWSL